MGIVAALDFLKKPEKYPVPLVCAIVGDESFLHRAVVNKIRELVLHEQDADFCLSRFDGNETTFKDVVRETAMTALFGSGKRLVVVEPADVFLSQNRDKLEAYVDEPNQAGILILHLSSLPANQRIYKKIAEKGLIVDCKSLPSRSLPGWILDWAPSHCQATLTRESAEVLVELVGDDMGTLEQEARRLSLLAPDGKISVELAREHVGSWRQHKVWDLVDAALDGRTPEAMRQLDKLIAAGEAPIAILAQMAATLRKLAAAGELLFEAENRSEKLRPPLSSVLDQVGVRSFVRAKTEEQLKKLGARRDRRLIQNLLATDLDLKGGSRSDPRLTLERFIVMISHPQMRPFDSLR